MAETYLSNEQFTVANDEDPLGGPVKNVFDSAGLLRARVTPEEFASNYTLVVPADS
jgi:hypothetical protein